MVEIASRYVFAHIQKCMKIAVDSVSK